MRITLSDRDPQGTTPWFHGSESLLAGGGAGLVGSVVTCPLDVIKTKLQAGMSPSTRANAARGAQLTAQVKATSRGHAVLRTMQDIWVHDGFRGFYRGLGPTILGYLPTWAIYFTVYDEVKEGMGRFEVSTPLVHMLAAMTAGASSTVVTNPLWVIKTRFMTQAYGAGEEKYKHTLDAVRRIYRAEGIGSFYRGLLPSLFGITHVAVQFPLYEQFKVYYKPQDGSDIPASTILFCSSASKMVASIATYPHEVLRTRMQIAQKPSASALAGQGLLDASKASQKVDGLIKTTMQVWNTQGLGGFYRGLSINLLRTIPNSACTILTYEVLMRNLTALSRQRTY